MNENNHKRGLQLAVINPITHKIETAEVFDTYKSSKDLDDFILNSRISKGRIVVAVCKDDCVTELSRSAKQWFSENLGSREIWKLKFRHGFALIGVFGDNEKTNEKRAPNE